MPQITINGKSCEFTPGEKILEIANREEVEIPQYCYHEGLSIPAQCRICLAEVHAPNPRNDGKVEPMMGGKLLPTCSTDAADGMVVHADSPKSVANQKAVMEYLLINHPLDCPVCDQAGECSLQDYSYKYGRGASRFEESKVKQPKKDLGPNIYIYSDRCIMCTRCVRFDREIAETNQLTINGRGNRSEIDVFPGVALDNEISANVIDLCPVGALLDKDFLFAQRVWFLKTTPSIDGITASGDNIFIEHNEGKIYRIKPRTNMDVNKWWITDEVRYGWKFVHSDDRLTTPMRRQYGTLIETDFERAYDQALEGLRAAAESGKPTALLVSPNLACEEAYLLAKMARQIDPNAVLAVGPVPFSGEDKHFPPSADADDPKVFKMYAEKAPNARGVRRTLEAMSAEVDDWDGFTARLNAGEFSGVIVTGNYAENWVPESLSSALSTPFCVVLDTLPTKLSESADVVIPSATWAEKAGTFENVNNVLQAFEQAIPVIQYAKAEGQIALDVMAILDGKSLSRPTINANDVMVDEGPGQVPSGSAVAAIPRATLYNAGNIRSEMAESAEALQVFATEVRFPTIKSDVEADMPIMEL